MFPDRAMEIPIQAPRFSKLHARLCPFMVVFQEVCVLLQGSDDGFIVVSWVFSAVSIRREATSLLSKKPIGTLRRSRVGASR